MSTFAPEIAIFAPAQPPRDNALAASSPAWQRSSPTAENLSPEAKAGVLTVHATGVVEEASAAQPISMKQRGTRLSFLGGKKKEPQQSQQSNGDTLSLQTKGDSDSNSQVSRGKDNSNRRSIFRTQSSDTNPSSNPHAQPYSNGIVVDATTPDWTVDRSRKSKEIVDVFESDLDRPNDGGIGFNSVKKRLSLLKLGKKPSKPNGFFMGGVSEE